MLPRVASLLCAAALLVMAEEPEIAHFESLIQASQYAEARTGLEHYILLHPESWQAQYQLGYVYFRLQRIQPSITAICKSLVLYPDFADSHKILAYDLNILGRQDLAMHELEIAIKTDPHSSESLYELGRIYYERGSYLEAIRTLERVKAQNPGFVRAYHNLGLAYSAIRENNKAVSNFEEGVARNAQLAHPSAWPLIDYATFYNLQGNFARARELLLQSLNFEDKWDTAYDELSKADRGLGMMPEAMDALRKAAALNPGKAEYHYVLARLLTQAHQTEQARAELDLYERKRTPQ